MLSKWHQTLLVVIAMVLSIEATGCINDSNQLNTTETAPSNSQESIEAIPTEDQLRTPVYTTVPNTPRVNELTSTPNFDTSKIASSFLFTPPTSNECHLPCWQGLTVGLSDRNDVLLTLEEVFGFIPENGLENEPAPDDMDSTAYVWRFDTSTAYEEFWITFTLTEDTQVLKGIRFYWTYDRFNSQVSPQRIISELGTPAFWLVSVTSAGNAGGFRSLMIYDNGIAFWTNTVVPIYLNEANQPSDLEFCLGGERWNDELHNATSGEVYITEPPVNGIEMLSPLQQQYYGWAIDSFDLVPAEIFFHKSLEELTQDAMLGECIISNSFD